jgi:hypothetical protein
MSNFFEFSDPIQTNPLRLTVTGYSDWITGEYEVSLFRRLEFPERPIVLGRLMGGKETDIMWSDSIHIIAISENIQSLLLANQITGWKTYPITVFNREGIELKGYSGLSIIGKECRRDRSRSQIITKQAVPNGEPFDVYKGLYFDESDWDGSDIFLVQHNRIVVTERVRKIFIKNKIRNVSLVPLSEVEIDVYLDKFEKES